MALIYELIIFSNPTLVNNLECLERYNSPALKNSLEKMVLYTAMMASCHYSLKQGWMHSFLPFYILIDLWWDSLRGPCSLKLYPSSADHELDSEMIWIQCFRDGNSPNPADRGTDFMILFYCHQDSSETREEILFWAPGTGLGTVDINDINAYKGRKMPSKPHFKQTRHTFSFKR